MNGVGPDMQSFFLLLFTIVYVLNIINPFLPGNP